MRARDAPACCDNALMPGACTGRFARIFFHADFLSSPGPRLGSPAKPCRAGHGALAHCTPERQSVQNAPAPGHGKPPIKTGKSGGAYEHCEVPSSRMRNPGWQPSALATPNFSGYLRLKFTFVYQV
jgi:hypothetical protein